MLISFAVISQPSTSCKFLEKEHCRKADFMYIKSNFGNDSCIERMDEGVNEDDQ